MCIQCGRAQTGFGLVQCALGVQCGQASSFNPILFHLHVPYNTYAGMHVYYNATLHIRVPNL